MAGGGGDPHVALERDGPLAVLRIDRPDKRGAFTFRMVEAIRAAADDAAADPDVVALAVAGTGGAFSAGLDTSDLARSAAGTAPAAEPRDDEVPALFSHLLRVPKPVIAAVDGVAAGGGFVLAMMCDLRFASSRAWFTTAFSKRGLVAEHGTHWLLPRLLGTSRALDLLWSSRRVDAEEALRIGLVDRLVPGDDLLGEVRRYVDELAASVSPRSLAVMKAQVYEGLSTPFGPSMQRAAVEVSDALAHPDATEGVASFVERRPPRFAPLDGGGR